MCTSLGHEEKITNLCHIAIGSTYSRHDFVISSWYNSDLDWLVHQVITPIACSMEIGDIKQHYLTHQSLGVYSPNRRTSREVSKPRDWMLLLFYHSEIWQASRQRCCRGARQILEQLEKCKHESRGLEASRDLAVRRPSVYWIEALSTVLLKQGEVGEIRPVNDNTSFIWKLSCHWVILWQSDDALYGTSRACRILSSRS